MHKNITMNFKKIKFLIIIIFIVCFALTSCSCNKNTNTIFDVTFVFNNGKANEVVQVKSGETVSTPIEPYKWNYNFDGWYTDKDFYYKYDFSKEVKYNLTLYAKYKIDAVKLTNIISTDTIKGVVKVYNKSYNTFLGIPTTNSTSQGSGFCFHIQNGYYYILTNCHVAVLKDSYKKQKFTIEDYQGNSYDGYLYKNPNKEVEAIAAKYDLACVYFKSTSTNVKKLEFASSNLNSKDDVIAVGAPEGQSNTITYGNVLNYAKITLKDTSIRESNVTFDVMAHNAYTNNGSSGCPILNANLEVVGVNYAGTENIQRAYAIPLKKIKEFLTYYVYN